MSIAREIAEFIAKFAGKTLELITLVEVRGNGISATAQ